MTQLYARVFVQILDSSISEDFFLRHVFEDFLKLASKQGIVDMTREAMSRRLNIPLGELSEALNKLEQADPKSRDPEFGGRRIERLDEHRDWGWRILNWNKYDSLRTKADVAVRVARHRANKQVEMKPEGQVTTRFDKPDVEMVKLAAAKAGLPEAEALKFFDYYESNGWRVGKNPMKAWVSALANWKRTWEERGHGKGNGELTVHELDKVIKAKEALRS